MLRNTKIFLMCVICILLLITTEINSRAKTYLWDDYSKPLKGDFIVSPSMTIEVDLPDYLFDRVKEIPLIIKHSGLGTWGGGSDEIILRINDQTYWNSYYIGRDRTYSGKPIRIIIKSKDLQSGKNKLTFVDHRTGTGRRGTIEIYELRLETIPQENLKTLDANEREVAEVKKPDKISSHTKISKSVDTKKSYLSETRWAVVIGISKYQDTRIPALRYASKDAQSFYNWLISPNGGKYAPSRVKLLIDEQATENRIRGSLFEWLSQALEEDIVMIYFAGHGSPQSPDKPDNLFLLPYDTKYNSVATTGFPMWDIETALKRFISAKRVIVITDACHAGGVGQSFDVARRAGRGINFVPISSNLQNLSKIGDGICIISASDDSQYSQESKKWGGGHGVFTYYLLQGLKGEADYSNDNRVNLGEIIPYLSEQVRRATRNAQTPTVAGRFDPALTIGK